jgi:hypothetical protein
MECVRGLFRIMFHKGKVGNLDADLGVILIFFLIIGYVGNLYTYLGIILNYLS